MIDLIVFLTLLFLGYVFGRFAETKHVKSIQKRERIYRSILTFSTKSPPAQANNSGSELVSGNVVISIDYFKKVAAGLRSLLGGRVTAYESLVERARREAILRMKEDARRKGAKLIFNVKLETSSITKGNQGQIGAVEVLAYGTALKNILKSEE